MAVDPALSLNPEGGAARGGSHRTHHAVHRSFEVDVSHRVAARGSAAELLDVDQALADRTEGLRAEGAV